MMDSEAKGPQPLAPLDVVIPLLKRTALISCHLLDHIPEMGITKSAFFN